MNKDKKSVIKSFKDYTIIFHLENEPLTFTNHIKHSVKTKDKSHVYSKTYSNPQIHKIEAICQISKMLE